MANTHLDGADRVHPAAPKGLWRSLDAGLGGLTAMISVLSGLVFLGMTALVVLQVFYRYALNAPLIGSEEAARIAMIYVTMIGAGLCIRNRTHMAVTFFRDRLPPMIARIADIAVALLIAVFALILIVKGAEFATRASFMKTPALQIPRSWVIYAFPIGGVLMLLYVIEDTLRGLMDRRLPPSESETDQ
ncbi:TRAP transporter small permease [Marinovum sp. SP66]|uniref:TRAP transporter small permease n=1 Tax=Marinovum sp. SP66 TaxID=3028379 RepID=UPI00237A6A94|nr:TRAP transporter small permease [Marinovum sp. SP66]MDD9739183.1 TRAP transporter small permease [Marinovum sp. SP66]